MSELPVQDCVLLQGLSPAECQVITAMGRFVEFPAGAQVITQGDEAHSLFFIIEGRLEVWRHDHAVAALERGQIFGEMSLFNEGVRTSDVRATSSVRLLEIDNAPLVRAALHNEPAAIKLMSNLGRLMLERLQRQDAQVYDRALEGDDSGRLEDLATLRQRLLRDWSLKYHALGRPGKLEIALTKPSATPEDLSVAYSPGVAEPCLAIQADPAKSFEYTARGHLVGVITNGTAVLGLGDIGALAAKPVMEGKAILFKKFADIDAFDIEVNETDPERFIAIVHALEPTFGGINLEDIKAPECFEIERRLRELLDIPVFHDDQHGTAIIAGAGLLNALRINGKAIKDLRVVFSGAGAAGVACARLFLDLGVQPDHLIMCDSRGVYHTGRDNKPHIQDLASSGPERTLAEALDGADAFVGVSVGGLLTPAMLLSMAADPIVFALANPTPEIDPATARATRADVIIATGRSDYPNQINNVIAFPFLFRGALDTRSSVINEAMKRAAAAAIADLVHEPITDPSSPLRDLSFGREYLIPKPFDPRLLPGVSLAVARAAMESGVAREPVDLERYARELETLAARR